MIADSTRHNHCDQVLGVAPQRYTLIWPTYIVGWSAADLKAKLAFGALLADATAWTTPAAPERRYALRLVRQRLHQATFREAVLTAYGGRCTINQGSQFTCAAFPDVLREHEVKISMDGKGAWRDNVFVERLWRTVKYEEVYLRAYDSVSEARTSIGRYLDLYNRRRPHSSLDGMTPDRAYFGSPPMLPVRVAA